MLNWKWFEIFYNFAKKIQNSVMLVTPVPVGVNSWWGWYRRIYTIQRCQYANEISGLRQYANKILPISTQTNILPSNEPRPDMYWNAQIGRRLQKVFQFKVCAKISPSIRRMGKVEWSRHRDHHESWPPLSETDSSSSRSPWWSSPSSSSSV